MENSALNTSPAICRAFFWLGDKRTMLREIFLNLIPSYMERFVYVIGGICGWLWGIAFGHQEIATAWFLALMAGDYIAGVYRACYFGEYQSKKGTRGLIKKFLVLSVCALSHGLDVIVGTACIQTAFFGAFGLNEMLSILENLGRVYPGFVPEQLQHFLTALKKRGIK